MEDRNLPSVQFTPGDLAVPVHTPIVGLPGITPDAAQGRVGFTPGFVPVEPQISVNPNNPANLILTDQNGLEVSTDGGATFGVSVGGSFTVGSALNFPLPAGATDLGFNSLTIPANGSCTVIFSVTSQTPGGHPNTTSGVTTTQTPAAGPASNTATLTVED